MKKKNTPKCTQCNSVLIVISSITEKLDGSLFPQTTTLYRCSNNECQERRDIETEKRLKMKKEKEKVDNKRAEERAHKKLEYLKQKAHSTI